MASIYSKKNSPLLYIRYQNEQGQWKGKPTGYKKGNLGDERQAKLLARRQTEIEKTRKINRGSLLEEWVLPWLVLKYGAVQNTLNAYRRSWNKLSTFFSLAEIRYANQIQRDFARHYLAWRTGEDEESDEVAGRNTAIQEIKLAGMIIEEAIHLGYCTTNPLRKLGLKKDKSPGKVIWTDEQIIKVSAHIEKTKTHWQQCTFYLGLYQASRLRQCQIPLKNIRLDLGPHGVIQYPDIIVKGGEAYAQPVDSRFRPILERLMATARKMGLDTLCQVKWDASLTWRDTLDRLGFEDISHHGLRATFITRAAENDVPEGKVMAFCHHSSAEVHRIYKKVSTAAIAHVSASVPLPAFCEPHPDRQDGDSAPAIPGNDGGESTSRTPSRTRDRARNRRRFDSVKRSEK